MTTFVGRFRIIQYSIIPSFLLLSLFITSCSRKPAEYYQDGMKSFVAGKYAEAQETFAKGIRKSANDSLYAGFVASNLITGKYPPVTIAYNGLSDSIHQRLAALYGRRTLSMLGIATKIVPYNVAGRNKIPTDFPQTIVLQEAAYYQGYLVLKEQVDREIRK